MKKMIGVINENLRSVINGIREHKEETEKNLVIIKAEMDEKIGIAAEYKKSVEAAREVISNLENEITELENDLNELNLKFGAKNFKEILNAGNKEINTKIIEKRASITKEREHIISLNTKAQQLKETLLKLKEKKITNEVTLKKAEVLLTYYESRIQDIIAYSEEHPEELDQYTFIKPSDDLIVSGSVLSDAELEHIVDGSVFQEIDKISDQDIDPEFVSEVLIDEPNDMEVEESNEPIDLSMTQQLDDIILATNNILAEEKVKEEKNKTEETPVAEEIKVEPSEAEPVQEKIEYIDINVPNDGVDYVNQVIDNNVFQDDSILPIENEENEVEEINEVPLENDFSLNEINEPTKADVVPSQENFYEVLKRLNLEVDHFREEDLITLESNFNEENTKHFIDVMVRHNIGISKIYENVLVLISVTPQNLDKILTLLESTKASSIAISYVFDKLDKVNINKLEEAVSALNDAELTEVLYEAIPYEGESDLVLKLDLNVEDENKLRTSCSEHLYKIMNMFPEIILANYHTLKEYNINNLRECITKHPKRFVMNPDNFEAILDKYDPDDLVRCINKNAAVIDRL